MPDPKTSRSHPIRVDWLEAPWPGRVGLTFAPGKKQRDAASGVWSRDLEADLKRIREYFKADHLICLLEDNELVELGISQLPEEAAAQGIGFHRLPIRDGDIPRSHAAVSALVARIAAWAAAGQNVVIHCKGGLGRAGTIGGCVLRAAGAGASEALSVLSSTRGPNCPETTAQRTYITDFVVDSPETAPPENPEVAHG